MTKLTEAQNALTSRKYKLALKLFRNIVSEEPENALAHQGLAQTLLQTRAHDEALLEGKKAMELDPSLSLPHVVMAYAYYSKKNLEDFRAEAHEAYKLNPVSSDVLTCYGIMLLVDKDKDRAINALTEAVRINPADIVARTNLAYAFSLVGNTKESLNQAKQVFSISPSISTAIRLLSAFHETYASAFGILLVLSTVVALLIRNGYLLLPATIYAGYAVWMGIRSIIKKKWKLGLLGIGYAILLVIIVTIIYYSIQ